LLETSRGAAIDASDSSRDFGPKVSPLWIQDLGWRLPYMIIKGGGFAWPGINRPCRIRCRLEFYLTRKRHAAATARTESAFTQNTTDQHHACGLRSPPPPICALNTRSGCEAATERPGIARWKPDQLGIPSGSDRKIEELVDMVRRPAGRRRFRPQTRCRVEGGQNCRTQLSRLPSNIFTTTPTLQGFLPKGLPVRNPFSVSRRANFQAVLEERLHGPLRDIVRQRTNSG